MKTARNVPSSRFMPGKRDIGPRFRVRDRVEISSSFDPGLCGRFARVIEIRESEHAQTLDKYLVLLDDSAEQKLLWDIELRAK
jgi:hypothetical protein